jgi:hypothetical protein
METPSPHDPRYAKFSQAVDRHLQTFDLISEWADVIAFLAKLLKASIINTSSFH